MRKLFTLAMTEKELQGWKASRQRGWFLFVLTWGVLYFGGLMLVFDVCWGVFAKRRPLISSVDGLQIAGDIVGGLIFGVLMWYSNESRYRKALGRESSTRSLTG